MGEDQKSGKKAEPTFSKEKLKDIRSKHVEWLALGEPTGERADLKGCNIVEARLEGAYLGRAFLTEANLERAHLEEARLERAHLKGAKLKGAYLNWAKLKGAYLFEACLKGAYLFEAFLEGAHLEGAHLEGAHLEGAHLEGAHLEGAHLEGAHLEGAHLEGAHLEGAHLEGAYLKRAHLERAHFERANLERAYLEVANLEVANLEGANLEGANLEGANLEGANLSGANVKKADLTVVNFKNSNITIIEYDRKIKCLGIRLDGCFGSTHFESFAKNQAFIEELKKGLLRKRLLYHIWNIFADCGRTPWRWILWMAIFVSYFAGLIFWMGPEQFRVSGETPAVVAKNWTDPHLAFMEEFKTKGAKAVRPVFFKSKNEISGIPDEPLPWTLSTTLYYSVVTFSTLGFGDVTPRTPTAAWVVTAEVLLGYIMLGGLISIFATLVTRRF